MKLPRASVGATYSRRLVSTPRRSEMITGEFDQGRVARVRPDAAPRMQHARYPSTPVVDELYGLKLMDRVCVVESHVLIGCDNPTLFTEKEHRVPC